MAGEILASQLNSLHNLYFYHRIMAGCREALRAGRADLWDTQRTYADGS
jgi:queuine/archaeosine tRNA-ribosyltransferase